MTQTQARTLARQLNEQDPALIAVATTEDAHAGRWERPHQWIVTTAAGATYYEPRAEG